MERVQTACDLLRTVRHHLDILCGDGSFGGANIKVLFLGGRAKTLVDQIPGTEPFFEETELSASTVLDLSPDLLISFGYRHLLSPEVLRIPRLGCLNIHISLLPWNRGSDPNFWSWLENTPKGVSVHHMVEKVDAGEIIHQVELPLSPTLTLRESYELLVSEASSLFEVAIDKHLANEASFLPVSAGSHHTTSDLARFRFLLEEDGWDTQCFKIRNYGHDHGLWVTED